MGYYTGNGASVGGSSSTSVLVTGWEYGSAFVVGQLSTVTNIRKAGVNLSDCTGKTATSSMTYHRFNGGIPIYNSKGSRVDYTYSRISDSNLYVLDEITTTCKVNLNNGAWQS